MELTICFQVDTCHLGAALFLFGGKGHFHCMDLSGGGGKVPASNPSRPGQRHRFLPRGLGSPGQAFKCQVSDKNTQEPFRVHCMVSAGQLAVEVMACGYQQ